MKGNLKSLEDTLQLLRAVQDSTSVCNVITDANQSIITFNREFAGFIKKYWKINAKKGDDICQYINPVNLQDFRKEFKSALEGKSITSEHTMILDTGKRMWLEVEYVPVKLKKESQNHVAFSFRDITKNRLSELSIIDQNKLLMSIAFEEAHQLRGPLTSLLGIINLLKSSLGDPESCQLYLQKINLLSTKLDKVISKIIERSHEL